MSTEVRPVEEWVRFFRHYKDTDILRPEYALTVFPSGVYCKLCDRTITGSMEDHMAAHTEQLAEYRAAHREVVDAGRRERLNQVRADRPATERSSSLTPEKRAYNRITSIRFKLNHPEKAGKVAWTEAERFKIEQDLEEAVAAHKALAGKE